MRTTTATLFTAITLIASTVQAKPPTVVYPTGVFPTDVQNVQAAINQGGTVLLKATDNVGHPLAFNFGPAIVLPNPPFGLVIIANDVSIVGEITAAGRTTISGGSAPFRVLDGKNSITGIKFDGPLGRAIWITGTRGTSVIGNEIDNVVPRSSAAQGFTLADGIDVAPLNLNLADIAGNVVISGNTFADLTGDFSIAIQVDSVATNLTISNNTFQLGQSVTDLGFFGSAAIGCTRCHSTVTISGNMITIGPGVVFNGIAISGGPDARYHVFGNSINSQGPFSDGIDIFGQGSDPGATVSAVIENNSINLLNTDIEQGSGIGLVGTVTNSTIQGNVVTGNGPTALYGFGALAPGEEVSDNRFLFNDIAQLAPSVASIFFDEQTASNIVRGQCVSVLDLGLNNNISCPSPASHAASFPTATRQQFIQRAFQSQAAVHASASSP
jgi:hypothetical protein